MARDTTYTAMEAHRTHSDNGSGAEEPQSCANYWPLFIYEVWLNSSRTPSEILPGLLENFGTKPDHTNRKAARKSPARFIAVAASLIPQNFKLSTSAALSGRRSLSSKFLIWP